MPNSFMNCVAIGPFASLKIVPSTCNPRGPYSCCNLVSISASCWQCGQVVNMNGSTRTLPRKEEIRTCLPLGSITVNSGDLRGVPGAYAGAPPGGAAITGTVK